MTDQTAIVKQNGNSLTRYGDRETVRELAARVKLMIYNGKHLNDDEAMALAQYAVVNQLNPTVGECYYIPGMGPGPGIAGWRKKADEQLSYEAHRAAEPMARFWTEYTDPTVEEVGNLNPGDIAVKSSLHDTLTKNHWEKRILSAYIECVKGGINSNEAMTVAREIVGTEPTWSAVGIVRAGENFGGDKMPRYERACKRADKAAIRKRFPRIDLPEPVGFDETSIIDNEPIITTHTETRSEADIMGEIGFVNTKPATLDPALILVNAGICDNDYAARGLLKHVPAEVQANETMLREWGRMYRGWRKAGATVEVSAENATNGADFEAE